ncbi:MAG: SRPBCC domain-containing protein [Actinomycetota bacterium]
MTTSVPLRNQPLRLYFEVDCPAPHAFEVWTSDITRWWPTEHTVTGRQALDIVLEPHVGGRIYERTAGGDELDWGEITQWEPPRRLAYRWHLREDGADAADVAVEFIQERAKTRIQIDHSGWWRMGAPDPRPDDASAAVWSIAGAEGAPARMPIHERSSGCSGPSCLLDEEYSQLLTENSRKMIASPRNIFRRWSGAGAERRARRRQMPSRTEGLPAVEEASEPQATIRPTSHQPSGSLKSRVDQRWFGRPGAPRPDDEDHRIWSVSPLGVSARTPIWERASGCSLYSLFHPRD